jgi:hypothetical protein
MIERYFIKRLIQQFALVVAKIISYKNKNDWQQVQMIVDVSLKQLLGLNPGLAESLDENALPDLFRIGGKTDHEKCLILGRLLYEQALIYENTQAADDKIYPALLKSFTLYKTALEDTQFKTKENITVLTSCCEKLLLYKLNKKVLTDIFNFYKDQKRFDNAEDILYLLLENDSSHKETAVSFYRDLLHFNDAVLEKGNLPRDEVVEGLRKFDPTA